MGGAVLLSQMQPGAEREDEFNEWYDREHVPARLTLPGFTGACRYIAVQGTPKYAVVYYMTGLDVLQQPPYQQLKQQPSERTARMLASVTRFTRYVAEETSRFVRADANVDPLTVLYLHMVLFAVPSDDVVEFERWYDEEHCPMLLRNRHWLQIRRYSIREGTPDHWTHLALHYLGDLAALESAERRAARDTPWRKRLAAQPWFKPEYAVCSRLPPRWEAC